MIESVLKIIDDGQSFFPIEDKSLWSAGLVFRDLPWIVSDHRGWHWELYGPKEARVEAAALAKKLMAGANILNRYIGGLVSGMSDKGEFILDNSYFKTRAVYDFFHGQILDRLNAPEEQPDTRSYVEIIKPLMKRGKFLEASTLSLVIFFFALLELVMDSCYALGSGQGKDFWAFRNKSWSERFLTVLSPLDRASQPIYEDLRELLLEYRHARAHATPEPHFLIPEVGWVPRDFEYFYRPRNVPWGHFADEEARRIVDLCNRALDLFEHSEKTALQYEFVTWGFSIPVASSAAAEVLAHMGSVEDLREYLEHRAEYEDHIANF